MATDWAADVKKYAADADDAIIAGIVRYCGIALQKVDSSLVAFSDPVELARVRNNFLKKKCGLTDADEVLDAAIADVGERMKTDRTKNRVTVYYLLSDRFGMHHLFVKAPKATSAKAAPLALAAVAAAPKSPAPRKVAAKPVAAKVAKAAKAAPAVKAAPAAALGVAALGAGAGAAMSVAPAAAMAAPAAVLASSAAVGSLSGPVGGASAAALSSGLSTLGHWREGTSPLGRKLNLFGGGGAGKDMAWFMWLMLGLAALALLWALFLHKPAPVAAPVIAVATPAAAPTPAPVEAVVPEGAGIITETRDEKPVVKVYFDTGKAAVAPAFAAEAAAFKTYLDAHPGGMIGVSGYNDPSGNAAANAALSKKRAEAVKAALVAAAIPANAVELIKPEAATDAAVTAAEARRVEVYIK